VAAVRVERQIVQIEIFAAKISCQKSF